MNAATLEEPALFGGGLALPLGIDFEAGRRKGRARMSEEDRDVRVRAKREAVPRTLSLYRATSSP